MIDKRNLWIPATILGCLIVSSTFMIVAIVLEYVHHTHISIRIIWLISTIIVALAIPFGKAWLKANYFQEESIKSIIRETMSEYLKGKKLVSLLLYYGLFAGFYVASAIHFTDLLAKVNCYLNAIMLLGMIRYYRNW